MHIDLSIVSVYLLLLLYFSVNKDYHMVKLSLHSLCQLDQIKLIRFKLLNSEFRRTLNNVTGLLLNCSLNRIWQ